MKRISPAAGVTRLGTVIHRGCATRFHGFAVLLAITALLAAGSLSGCAPAETRHPFSRLDPGGVVLGLALEDPLPLDELLAWGETLDGDVIAVYRTDYACVRPITGGAPEWQPEPSRFAYVDAGKIRERRLAAVNAGLSSPITGQLIAESYWLHWEDQWAHAQEPDTLLEGLAVYVPSTANEALRNDPRVRTVEVLPHRRTDSLDPDFAGELLLETEDFTPGVLSEPPLPDCGS